MNGADCLPAVAAMSEYGGNGLYVVVFTSTPRLERDVDELRRLDDAAYAEAVESGGLLRYIRGSYDGASASVCIWRCRADAVRAAHLPAHMEAASRVTDFYEAFELRTYGGW